MIEDQGEETRKRRGKETAIQCYAMNHRKESRKLCVLGTVEPAAHLTGVRLDQPEQLPRDQCKVVTQRRTSLRQISRHFQKSTYREVQGGVEYKRHDKDEVKWKWEKKRSRGGHNVDNKVMTAMAPDVTRSGLAP